MRHILIHGARRAGKSTLIARLLTEISCPVYGYVTKRLDADDKGMHPIYIHEAGDYFRKVNAAGYELTSLRGRRIPGLDYEASNLAALCDSVSHKVYLQAFDKIGTDYIRNGLKSGTPGIIVMDELGFLEAEALKFRNEVFTALDGSIPVIAAVKAFPEAEFTSEILQHTNADVYEITESNREEVFKLLQKKLQKEMLCD